MSFQAKLIISLNPQIQGLFLSALQAFTTKGFREIWDLDQILYRDGASTVFVCTHNSSLGRVLAAASYERWYTNLAGSWKDIFCKRLYIIFSNTERKIPCFSWTHLLICHSHTYAKMCVDTCVPRRSSEVLVFSIRYMLMCSLITKLLSEPKVYHIY